MMGMMERVAALAAGCDALQRPCSLPRLAAIFRGASPRVRSPGQRLLPVACAAFALVLPAAGRAQQAETHGALRTRVQTALDSLYATGTVPGATVGVALADGTVLGFAAGEADTARAVSLRPEDRMLAGSVGKTYVAAVALQLVAEGGLRLDEPIATYLGDRPWFARLPNARAVTVRMLMNHTSGIERYEFDPRFAADLSAQPDRVWRPEEQIAYVLDKEPPFAAGEGWTYSDTNYLLLGLIIEEITGAALNDEIARRVLTPLGLAETAPSDRRSLPGLVQGYAGPNNPFGGSDAMLHDGRFAFNPGFEWAGGGYYTSARDLAEWARLLYTGRAFPDSLVEQAVAGVQARGLGPGARYGLGVIVQETPLGVAYGHSGFFPGYLTEMRYYPEHGFAVAVQVNTSHGRPFGRGPGAALQSIAEVVAAAR
jgi:D-alanyl-D-alanine carboxypeptidase